jgi:hypothetical protein
VDGRRHRVFCLREEGKVCWVREEGKGLRCVGGGKGLLCTGGDKGSAACGRRERVCYETVLFTVQKKTVFKDQNGINFKKNYFYCTFQQIVLLTHSRV